jgi:KaiC/GvpD/RAD55 family RecA-like ATPase
MPDFLSGDPYAELLPKPVAPLPLLYLDQISPVLDGSDFVQGVLMEGSSAVVYGESTAGKTFFTTDLALRVAAGMKWNGRRVDQGGVVYVAMEGGTGFRNRVHAFMAEHQLEGMRLPFAAIPASVNLLDAGADMDRLLGAIQAATERMGIPIKLIVLDTLSRAMAGGNENDSADMGALVRNMDTVREQTGACVLAIHHSGKDISKGARGHSLLRAALDTEIEVRADDATGIRTATVVKQREMAKGDTFTFTLRSHLVGKNRHGEDVTTATVQPSEADAVGGRLRTKKARVMTSTQHAWHQDLIDIFARSEPKMDTPVPGMSPVPVLSRKAVREGYRLKGYLTSDTNQPLTERERTKLHSGLMLLKSHNKIGMTNTCVWLIPKRESSRNHLMDAHGANLNGTCVSEAPSLREPHSLTFSDPTTNKDQQYPSRRLCHQFLSDVKCHCDNRLLAIGPRAVNRWCLQLRVLGGLVKSYGLVEPTSRRMLFMAKKIVILLAIVCITADLFFVFNQKSPEEPSTIINMNEVAFRIPISYTPGSPTAEAIFALVYWPDLKPVRGNSIRSKSDYVDVSNYVGILLTNNNAIVSLNKRFEYYQKSYDLVEYTLTDSFQKLEGATHYIGSRNKKDPTAGVDVFALISEGRLQQFVTCDGKMTAHARPSCQIEFEDSICQFSVHMSRANVLVSFLDIRSKILKLRDSFIVRASSGHDPAA